MSTPDVWLDQLEDELDAFVRESSQEACDEGLVAFAREVLSVSAGWAVSDQAEYRRAAWYVGYAARHLEVL